jgi:fatty acid desaturase
VIEHDCGHRSFTPLQRTDPAMSFLRLAPWTLVEAQLHLSVASAAYNRRLVTPAR